MKKSVNIAGTVLLLSAAAAAAEIVSIRPFGGVEVREEEGAWVVTSRAEHLTYPEPALAAYVDEPVAADRAMVLEAVVRGDDPAQLFLATSGRKPFLTMQGARSSAGGEKSERLLWSLNAEDTITSMTLSVRSAVPGGEVTVESLSLKSRDELGLADAIEALGVDPVVPLRTWTGLQPTIPCAVFLPSHLATMLDGAELQLRADGATKGGEGIAFVTTLKADAFDATAAVSTFTLDLSAPNALAEPITVRAAVQLADKSIVNLGTSRLGVWIDTKGQLPPWYESEFRSVEDFAAFEWNGDLFLAVLTAPGGFLRSREGERLPTDSLDLLIEKANVFAPIAGVLSVPDQNLVASGGFASPFVSTGMAKFNVLTFTTASPTGSESLSVAAATNSVRIAPHLTNPVFVPPENRDGVTHLAWRGNVTVPYRDGYALLALVIDAAGKPELRAAISPAFASWLDLGTVPLDLAPTTRWLSGWHFDGTSYLLAGPPAALYKSTDPIRSWEPLPVSLPEHWGRTMVVRYRGAIAAFGLAERYGRGVVEWSPLTTFDAAKGLEVRPVPPPPRE